MIKEYCFWLTTIKSQGGSEYYCEAPYKKYTEFNCEGCDKYIHISDMQEYMREIIEAKERIFEWK